MGDYKALNHKAELPTRKTDQRDPTTGNETLKKQIRENLTQEQINQYIKKLQHQQQSFERQTNNIQQQESPDIRENDPLAAKQTKIKQYTPACKNHTIASMRVK